MHTFLSFITGIVVAIGGFFGLTKSVEAPPPITYRIVEERVVEKEVLGAISPVAGSTYNLAGGGVTSSATSITLQSLTLKQTGQFLTTSDLASTTGVFYLTLEPGNNSRQEIASCTTVTQNTGGTATLSGCVRGLAPIAPFTASTTLQFAHGGGTQVIFSDPPQFFNQYAAKDNRETISGLWSFSSTTPPRYDQPPPNHHTGSVVATTSEFASVEYVNATGAGANVNASETVRGEVELGTRSEIASTTSTGGTGARLAIPATAATSTPGQNIIGGTGNSYVVVTRDDNTIHPNFIATSTNDPYRFGGFVSFNTATATHATTSTLAAYDTRVSTLLATSTAASGFGTTTPAGQVAIEIDTNAFPFYIGNQGTPSPALVVSSAGRLGIGTSSPLATTTITGHIQFGGNKPAISSCGTGPSVVGNDVSGRITVGTGTITACTLTFSYAWTNAPACFLVNKDSNNPIDRIDTSTTAFTLTDAADFATQNYNYLCIGFE